MWWHCGERNTLKSWFNTEANTLAYVISARMKGLHAAFTHTLIPSVSGLDCCMGHRFHFNKSQYKRKNQACVSSFSTELLLLLTEPDEMYSVIISRHNTPLLIII